MPTKKDFMETVLLGLELFDVFCVEQAKSIRNGKLGITNFLPSDQLRRDQELVKIKTQLLLELNLTPMQVEDLWREALEMRRAEQCKDLPVKMKARKKEKT